MKERIKGAFTKKKILHVLKMALFVVALSLILLSLLGTCQFPFLVRHLDFLVFVI